MSCVLLLLRGEQIVDGNTLHGDNMDSRNFVTTASLHEADLLSVCRGWLHKHEQD